MAFERGIRQNLFWLILISGALSSRALVGQDEATVPQTQPTLELKPYRTQGYGSDWLHGTMQVFEDRSKRHGRMISLYVVVLPARSKTPAPDPVFFLMGGPGGAATDRASSLANSWMRSERDIVLVDQRGTGKSNPLHVKLPGSDDDLQGFLDPIFQVEVFQAAKIQLEDVADLRFYTTPIAMDDLDDVRAALGYQQINLLGGSYGSRAAMIYMRRHEEHVRTATLSGIAPVSFINPLYHAAAAQEGLEAIFFEIEADPRKAEVFPDLKKKFNEILARLDQTPAEVLIKHPRRNEQVTVRLTRDAFCEAVRVMMYRMGTNRRLPMLMMRAWEGDYAPFALAGIKSNRQLRGILAMGMLMSVVGSEDIPRITEQAIKDLTADTFLGDARVRSQMAVSEIWPRGDVPANYGDPVNVKTPTLLISGSHDPVTPPRWGEQAARHLPNSLHLIVPAVHGSYGSKVERIKRAFLKTGTVSGLDTSELESSRMPPLHFQK